MESAEGPATAGGESHLPRPGHEERPKRLLAATRPAAVSSGYAFSKTQRSGGAVSPVTWSPCRPIHYVVDVAGAPAAFPADVGQVVAEVSAATGLAFVNDGMTSEIPRDDRDPFQLERYGDRWAPVLIGFIDSRTIPALAGDVAGVGGPASVVDPRTRTSNDVSGIVYLDSNLLAAPPSGRMPTYVPVLRHEFGHLMGLAHTDDSTQLMFPTNRGLDSFQTGDFAGLAELGQGSCAPGL